MQPEGNYYNKYESQNIVEKRIMNGFFKSINNCLGDIKFNTVLEAGCGEGKVTNYIKEYYNCQIEGFDIGANAIKKAQKDFREIQFCVKSIYDAGYEDNSFDLVLCCEVLEHLEEYDRAMEELLRISNKYVLISVPCEPLWRILNMCRFKYIKDLGNTPGHINHWSKAAFINFLKRYGKIMKVESPLPWTMVLLEKQ